MKKTCLIVVLLGLSWLVNAAQIIEDPLRALFFTQHYAQVAISPNGQKVAWLATQIDKKGGQTGKFIIYVADIQKKTNPVRISAGKSGELFDEENLVWSPDSTQVAFLSDAAKENQQQLYVASARGGQARKITNIKGILATPKWSPEGHEIAVLFTENATGKLGPLAAGKHETGVIKDVFLEQRLAIVNVTSGALRQITPADRYVYEYNWAPDGKGFVLIAAEGNGDNNWWIAELFTVNLAAQEMQRVYKPTLQISSPVISPDGKSIAFIEGLMSDAAAIGGDVFLIARDGGKPRNLTPGHKGSVGTVSWASAGEIIGTEYRDGESSVIKINTQSGQIKSLYTAPEFFTSGFYYPSLSLTPDGKSWASVRSSIAQPPEIWVYSEEKWQPITNANREVKPTWGVAKNVHWNNEGHDMQGWLVYPKNVDPKKKYPMIVDVHGGPSWGIPLWWPIPFIYSGALPAYGYFVFYPNPRGSYGQGEDFTRANIKDFGYGDFRDILAGVDQVLRIAPVDPQRLGLTGWSYGGYMTMWGVTQTNRFRAASAGAGVANWISYYGQNKIDQWLLPFFGKSVYDDPAIYARSSPITFIKNVKTPTLILVGDSDGECPPPQSYEFWHALKALGVETALVVYENEGHMFIKPENTRDVIQRNINWFDAHLK
ncbi:MAG: S9 family peptidase [Pseudomonadota bacterium]|nr:S9 family peptidase [Pseudomonadota bacterium]